MKSNKICVNYGDWLNPDYFEIRVVENNNKLYIEVSYIDDGVIYDKNIIVENTDNKHTHKVIEEHLKRILKNINITEDVIKNIAKHINKNLYIDFPEVLSYKIGEIGFNDIMLQFLQN